MIGKVNSFFDFVLSSAAQIENQLGEYSVATLPESHPAATHGIGDDHDSIAAQVGHRRRHPDVLRQQIKKTSAAEKPPRTPSISSTCHPASRRHGRVGVMPAFCGYHSSIGTRTFSRHALCELRRMHCGSSAFDAVTSISSHERCEAITDPIPGQGWYDDTMARSATSAPGRQEDRPLQQSSWSGRNKANPLRGNSMASRR